MIVKLKHQDHAGKPIEVEAEHVETYKTQGWVEVETKPADSK